MITATTIEEARKAIKKWKAEGLTVGLAPTMGALHDGHASLVTAAVSDCDRVVTSVSSIRLSLEKARTWKAIRGILRETARYLRKRAATWCFILLCRRCTLMAMGPM